MAASESKLGALHEKVADVLCDALDGEELPAVIDDEGNVLQEAKRLPASAAVLAVAAKFLKDNNITCVPSEDNALGDLRAAMEERKAKRAARVSAREAEQAASGFFGGMQ